MDAVDRIFNLVDAQYREQRDFAYDLGLTASIVSAWRCRRSASYVKYLPQIAKLLGTSAEYLLTGEMPPDWAEKTEQTAAPEGNGLPEEFARLFAGLAPEDQTAVIADMLRRGRAKGK